MKSRKSVFLVLVVLLLIYGCSSTFSGSKKSKVKSSPESAQPPGAAPASDWVLAKSKGHLSWKISEYIHQDSVTQKDNNLIFWYEIKQTKRGSAQQKVIKVEASLINYQYRYIETYSYTNGSLVKIDATPSKYLNNADFKEVINKALKYAKEGDDTNSVPSPL